MSNKPNSKSSVSLTAADSKVGQHSNLSSAGERPSPTPSAPLLQPGMSPVKKDSDYVNLDVAGEDQPGHAFDVNDVSVSKNPYSDIKIEGDVRQIKISRSGISSRFKIYGKTIYNSYEIDAYKFIGVVGHYVSEMMMYILLAGSVSSIMQYYTAHPDGDGNGILIPKNMVYIGCAIYAFARLVEAFFVFMSSRYDANVKDLIVSAWGSISTHHGIVYKKSLPELIISDFDIPRFLQGILSIGMIVAGNWLISKNLLSYGLALMTFGFVVLSFSVTGFVNSQQMITENGYNFVKRTFNTTLVSNKNIDQNNFSEVTKQLNKLEEIVGKMKAKAVL